MWIILKDIQRKQTKVQQAINNLMINFIDLHSLTYFNLMSPIIHLYIEFKEFG